MTDKRFVDIEVGADTGLIRLYTSDENYNEYNGMEVLKMLNELHDENEAFKKADNLTDCETQIMKLKTENKKLKQLLLQFYTEDEIEAELI